MLLHLHTRRGDYKVFCFYVCTLWGETRTYRSRRFARNLFWQTNQRDKGITMYSTVCSSAFVLCSMRDLLYAEVCFRPHTSFTWELVDARLVACATIWPYKKWQDWKAWLGRFRCLFSISSCSASCPLEMKWMRGLMRPFLGYLFK